MTHPIVERFGPAAAAEAGDRIRVFIRDCRIELPVGVFDSEMQKPQPVLVNVEMEAALLHRYNDPAERSLDRVINYAPVYDFIQNELSKQGHIFLLENAAERIVDYCFRDVRIEKVRVRLEKTAVFDHAAGAGIEVTRSRAVKT